MTEWESFRKRETDFEGELIVPITFHDGEHFPERARDTEQTDCSAYASRFSAFWESQQAVEFEKVLKKIASRLGKVIKAAPAFTPDFPVVEGKIENAPAVGMRRLD